MNTVIDINFKNKPSMLYTMCKAIIGARWRFSGLNNYKEICAIWENANADLPHLNAFHELCEIEKHEILHPLYPVSLVFPLIMRILGHRKAPLTIFKTLNTRLQVHCHKPIHRLSKMKITCQTDGLRIMQKGLELDLKSHVYVKDICAWESLHTFYYRGSNFSSQSKEPNTLPKLNDISGAPEISTWFLPENKGWRFASVSGDSNGLHYSKLYAKMFGFNRDFAQPLLIMPRALDQVLQVFKRPLKKLDIQFKGPVYYNRNASVHGCRLHDNFCFDIYNEGNVRPCMTAVVE